MFRPSTWISRFFRTAMNQSINQSIRLRSNGYQPMLESLESRNLMCVVANDDFVATFKNTSISIHVLGNDDFGGSSNVSIVNITQGTGGSATLNSDNTILFVPAANQIGFGDFSYSISNGTDEVFANVLVNVALTPQELAANYLAAVSQADGVYQSDVLSAESQFESAIGPILATFSGLYEDYQAALSSAAQTYQSFHDLTQSAYDIDPNVEQASLAAGASISSAYEAFAISIAQAQSTSEEDAASALLRSQVDSAIDSIAVAASDAWNMAQSAEDGARMAYSSAEQTAWISYESAYSSAVSTLEYLAGFCANSMTNALSAWTSTESLAWETYTTAVAAIQNDPALLAQLPAGIPPLIDRRQPIFPENQPPGPPSVAIPPLGYRPARFDEMHPIHQDREVRNLHARQTPEPPLLQPPQLGPPVIAGATRAEILDGISRANGFLRSVNRGIAESQSAYNNAVLQLADPTLGPALRRSFEAIRDLNELLIRSLFTPERARAQAELDRLLDLLDRIDNPQNYP